jgi:hypothetical protein
MRPFSPSIGENLKRGTKDFAALFARTTDEAGPTIALEMVISGCSTSR